MPRTCPVVRLASRPTTAVVMKVPKPKEGEEPRKIWVPMERLWFDKNQRVQVGQLEALPYDCIKAGAHLQLLSILGFAVSERPPLSPSPMLVA